MERPMLSIIMIVFNAERFISEAISSILEQTFADFEFIIIDDGSDDGSLNIIKSFNDNRIRVLLNPTNKGIVFTRNRGLEESKGRYIAMLDADDVAYKTKFEEQIGFLQNNKDYGMIGSWVRLIDEYGQEVGNWKLTASSDMITSIMLFKCYFQQSAVVYRSECILGLRFQEGLEIGEDYKMFLEITAKYKTWNLQKYLVKYRFHPQNKTCDKALLKRCDKAILREHLEKLGINPTERDLDLHLILKYGDRISDYQTLKELMQWLEKIIIQNRVVNAFNQAILTKIVFYRWLKACYLTRSMPIHMLFKFAISRILRWYLISLIKPIARDENLLKKE